MATVGNKKTTKATSTKAATVKKTATTAKAKTTPVKKVEKVEEKEPTISAKDVTSAVASGVAAGVEAAMEKTHKQSNDSDLITCRSVTFGKLIVSGKSFDDVYIFYNYGDTCEISVKDLKTLRSTRSRFLFDPMFMIEDEEFLEQPEWSRLKKLYDELTYKDAVEILNLPNDRFEKALGNLPDGFIKAIQSAISTGLTDGTFDSISKVRIFDRVCGTDLKCLIG